MYLNAGYYYYGMEDFTEIDIAPSGQLMFVVSAGHFQLRTLPYHDTIHASREDYQIIYINKGTIYYYEDGFEKKAPAGSFVFYKPKERQRYRFFLADAPDIYWVHLTGPYAKVMLEQYNLLNSRFLTVAPSKKYAHIYNKIISSLQNRETFFDELNSLYIQELILNIAKAVSDETSSDKKTPEHFLKIMKYIDEHYNEDIHINELAKEYGLSSRTLLRYFNKYLNTTPTNFITKKRIEKAQILFQSSNQINQIARAVGFSDPLYFSTVFKKHTGLSPSQFIRKRSYNDMLKT